MYGESLEHHGITGMKWGVRHGPPYPLKAAVSNAVRITGTMKEKHVRTEDGGHDSSNSRAELYKRAALILLDVAMLNPYGLAEDTSRLGMAFVSSRRNSKYTKERAANKSVDPETGLKLKSKDQDLSDKEELKRVNPNVNDFNSDSKNNCMLCTTTYEMRRRGYDVTAQRDGSGYLDDEVTRWFPNAKVNTIKNNTKHSLLKGYGEYADNVIAEMKKQPEGSRGNLILTFGALGGRHSVCYEIQNGELIIRDAQIAKIYKDPKKLLDKCGAVNYVRYDNVAFNKKGIKEACYS